jgi:hypothetical protein
MQHSLESPLMISDYMGSEALTPSKVNRVVGPPPENGIAVLALRRNCRTRWDAQEARLTLGGLFPFRHFSHLKDSRWRRFEVVNEATRNGRNCIR